MRAALLLLACGCLGLAGPSFRFLHPKQTVYLAGMRGASFPVQVFIPRDARNRAYVIRWDGESCGGGASGDLDGEEGAAVQPTEPLTIRAGEGVCELRAAVFDASGKIRQSASVSVTVR